MTMSLKPPRSQLNILKKTSMLLCALRYLCAEFKTPKIVLFLFFIDNFDDTDLFDSSLPIGGGDSDGSNGKAVGCASY